MVDNKKYIIINDIKNINMTGKNICIKSSMTTI